MPAPTSNIIQPRFIALDSSHLGAIVRDKASRKDDERQKALALERALEKSSAVLLLCWHHIQELLSHRDSGVVAQRVGWIRSLPLVASITSIRGENLPGSVIDIQAFEARAAFEAPTASLLDIRHTTAEHIFRVVSGAELIQPFMENWSALQTEFAAQEARGREVVAISRSGFANISSTKIADLLPGKATTSKEIQQHFDDFHNRLSQDIRQRGDKRIPDPESSSETFLQDVMRLGIAATSEPNPGLQILLANGIDISEIGPETTVGDVGILAAFQKKLSIVNRNLGLPWRELKARVTEHRLPSSVIQSAVEKFRSDTAEWKGSDLTDTHLACLSAYADVTYLDKRTHEAFRRARQGSKEFAAIVRHVEKASDYGEITRGLLG